MKEIKLQNKTYLFVEVPKDAYDFKKINQHFEKFNHTELAFTIPNSNDFQFKQFDFDFKIISTLSNISEEDAIKLVEKVIWMNKNRKDIKYHSYLDDEYMLGINYSTAKESLQSLITSLGLSGEVLILQKI